MDRDLLPLFERVETALADTEREYALLPFFVRGIVRRGFARRTGNDFAGWRALLADARQGRQPATLADALAALAEHYRGAPERARRGRGATPAQLAIIEERSLARADAASALRAALS